MSAKSQRHWRFTKEDQGIQLNIGIVGAGIAGLAAAAALIRCGHRVEVFERSESKTEVGAALGVSPNVSGILRAIDFDYERARGLIIKQTRIFDGPTLDVLYQADWAHVPETYGADWYALHRADYHQELRHLATNPPEGIKSADLKFGKRVVSVDCEQGIINFEDGKRIQKDIVVGADGLHSAVAKCILGDALPPLQTSGQSAFRCLVRSKAMYENRITRPWFHEPKWEPNIIMKVATSSDRRIIFYPCRGGELFNFVGLHPTSIESMEDERWQGPGKIEDFLDAYETFHPALREACRHAEDLKLWKLQFRAPIKSWSKGRAILLGDAAHPMLPHQAQAANMALEDVGAFVALLSSLESKEEIPRRLQMVQEVRGNRTSAMQVFSNSPQDQPDKAEEKVQPYMEGRKVPKNSVEFADFIFGYDLLGAVETKLRAERSRAKLA